jgi:hypothetical protein
MAKTRKPKGTVAAPDPDYSGLVSGITELLEQARRAVVRAVNSALTATYWEVGRRVVEFEQGGQARAEYGEALLVRLAQDLGAFTHADAGQMNLYLNYAREHWVKPGENPPVRLILCAQKGRDVARYALGGLANQVLAAEYRTALPEESLLTGEIERTRRMLERGSGETSAARGQMFVPVLSER